LSEERPVSESFQEIASAKTTAKDPTFKRLIQTYFEEEHLNEYFSITSGMQVGQLQLEIDVTISVTEPALKTEEIQERLTNTPFWFFNRYNLVEFKSISDPLSQTDFARIVARATLAWANQLDENRTGLVSCIISAAWPHKFLSKSFGKQRFRPVKGKPGIWFHPGLFFPIYLIVCNRLPLEEVNYPLLVFSSGEKLKSFLRQIALDSRMEIYFNFATQLHPLEAAELAWQRRSDMTTAEKEKVLQILLKTYTLDELIKLRLSNLEPNELDKDLDSLGKVLEMLTPQQREKLRRQLEN
jgi:hypothetical protein